jgi:putative methionine-R-sulfoxide reductase with GAF domain
MVPIMNDSQPNPKNTERLLRLELARNSLERSQLIVLYTIGFILFLGSMAGSIVLIMFNQAVTPFAIICVVISLFMFGLLRSKYWRWATLLYPTILIAVLTTQAYLNDGLYDESVYGFFAVTAIAGLLLRRQGVVVFTFYSVAAVIGLGYAHIIGLFPKYSEYFSPHRIFYMGLLMAVGGALLYLVIDNLVQTIDRLNENEKGLESNNQELQFIRESLEKQVMERTAAAELARLDSENARREAEAQAWFTRGQAQLAERMRGDQSIETLANNVTSYLCHYLGAHTGALYLVEQNHLKLTGRYAYTEQTGQKNEIGFEDNLVGEAAKTRRTLKITNISDDAPFILSALGNIRPKQLLLAPIEAAGKVFGVLELATLEQFTAEHELFLGLVSENVAIAFHTTQTRVQINGLLEKTQNQTQESDLFSSREEPRNNYVG